MVAGKLSNQLALNPAQKYMPWTWAPYDDKSWWRYASDRCFRRRCCQCVGKCMFPSCTLWSFDIAVEDHHFQQVNHDKIDKSSVNGPCSMATKSWTTRVYRSLALHPSILCLKYLPRKRHYVGERCYPPNLRRLRASAQNDNPWKTRDPLPMMRSVYHGACIVNPGWIYPWAVYWKGCCTVPQNRDT